MSFDQVILLLSLIIGSIYATASLGSVKYFSQNGLQGLA